MRAKITAIIHTLNEEANLANALRSVASWVDEVLVVDMHSDDLTVEIALSLGARVLLHERTGMVESARAFADAAAQGDWIFVLDADEIVPRPLSLRLRQIADGQLADACYLPRLNYFAGAPLLHSGWGPRQDRLLRFYRKGLVTHSNNIHTQPQLPPDCRTLTLASKPGLMLVHFNYLNASHFLTKLDRYTSLEAAQRMTAGRRPRAARMLLGPLAAFVKRYFAQQGFRDGWRGLYYALLMLVYRCTTEMKLRELSSVGEAGQVRARYQRLADELLAAYTEHGA